MRDGLTQKIKKAPASHGISEFLSAHRPRLVVVRGPSSGEHFDLEAERVTLGLGPGVDLAFDDPAMSRQHAAIEYADGGFRIRDMGSTNGVLLNGEPVQAGEMRHGDRFEIGAQRLQLVIEEREEAPPTYELPAEG